MHIGKYNKIILDQIISMGIKRTITLKKKVIESIEKVAKSQNRNFSNIIETMCIWYLENKK